VPRRRGVSDSARVKTRALSFSARLAAGVVVTKRLHGDPEAGIWGERIADTRLRYANLPVGGTIALGLSAILPERWAPAFRALGTGALLGAVGWGIVDPLPPVS
jgi:hypothetical protein